MSQQIPDRNNPLGLFEYSVRRVIQLNLMGKINTHQVWANYIFKSEKNPEVRKDLMSIVMPIHNISVKIFNTCSWKKR